MTTQSLSFVVLTADLDNFREIRAALATDSRAKLLSGGNDMEQVHDDVVRLKPSAAIINLGASSDQAIKLIQRLKEECPETAIISVAKETSADLILQSLRSGALEFLRLPISADELKTVLDRIGEFCAEIVDAPPKSGPMTAVFSSKGGCGTSFIATNIAASSKGKTLLVDLNFESGDLALFLGLDPRRSVGDILSHRGALDQELLAAYVTPYSENFHLLAAPKEVDPVDKIKPEQVFDLLHKLREFYDHVVLDPQHTFDALTMTALDQSDKIVLVLTLDIPSIRSAKRALTFFDRIGYPRSKTIVFVNRWSKQVDLDLHQVEDFLGSPVSGCLLSDYQMVVNSINMGEPLVESNPSSKIARGIITFTQSLAAGKTQPQPQRPKRSWSFFSRRSSGQSNSILRT